MVTRTSPQVGVIIPCYQQGHLLAQAVDSLLNQSRPVQQIIVVNDGSTDDTHAVAQRYSRQIIYCPKTNQGVSAARNTGVLHCTADVILFLDADDTLVPDAIEHLIAAFEADPALDVVVGGWRHVNAAGQVLTTFIPPPLGQDPVHFILPSNHIAMHSAMIRRASLANSGLFDPKLTHSEDMEFWLRLALSGARFGRVEAIIANYRLHEGTATGNVARMYQTRLEVCREFARRTRGNRAHQKLARRSVKESMIEEIIALAIVPFSRQPSMATCFTGVKNWLALCMRHPRQTLYTGHALAKAARLWRERQQRTSTCASP